MRIFFSPRRWMSVGIMCLSAASVMGCRSPGMGSGMGWLSWMNPKPSSTGLASTPPTKPSIASLPNPNATTGSTAQTMGNGTSLVSHPSGTQASQSTPNQYNTGPYGMSGHGGAHSATGQLGGSHSHSPQGYSGGVNQTPGTGAAYSGYQSPYGNTGAARTADSRNAYGAPDASNLKASPYAGQGVAPAGTNSSSDQWNRGAYGPAGGTPAAFNDTVAPRGYGENVPDQSTGSAGSWTPPANTGAPSNYLDRFSTGSAGSTAPAANPVAPRRDGGAYQPGSTSRNGGSLPASPTGIAQQAGGTNATLSGSYPTTSYPTTGYPSMDSRAPAGTANSAGSSAYPTSAPLLR